MVPQFNDTKANNPFTSTDQKQVYKAQMQEKFPKQQMSLANDPLNEIYTNQNVPPVPPAQLKAQNKPPTLFEFKINDQTYEQKGQKPPADPMKKIMDQGVYPLNMVPVPNPLIGYGNLGAAYNIQQQPIVKNYNITMSNATGDLVKLHDLYEDILPQVNGIVQKNLTTIGERKVIYQYLRSLFIKHTDGEEISIVDTSIRNSQARTELLNLLSHIKMMDINPYHFSGISTNPYKTLPSDFIMFRSCYPMRLTEYNSTKCAPDNIGLNIRIYQMRVMDILAEKFSDKLKRNDCDLWREIGYYEFVREEIIKKNICPNFIMINSWYITKKSGVDFEKLKKLRNDPEIKTITKDNEILLDRKLKESLKDVLLTQKQLNPEHLNKLVLYTDKAKELEDLHGKVTLPKGAVLSNPRIPLPIVLDNDQQFDASMAKIVPSPQDVIKNSGNIIKAAEMATLSMLNPNKALPSAYDEKGKLNFKNFPELLNKPLSYRVVNDYVDLFRENLAITTNRCIVALTEAPTQNIFDWGTRSYSLDHGPRHTMVQTGYHDIKVWQSIIFQILAAMYTMIEKGIAIREMSMENVFIKDLSRDENNVGFWKYKIKNIDFYVPNYGYLVLIDSKFKEVTDGQQGISSNDPATAFNGILHKMVGEVFGDDKKDVMQVNKDNMARIFNANVFKSNFKLAGGIEPPPEILANIDLINSRFRSQTPMCDIFIMTQSHFLNNRIGTVVKDVEKDMLMPNNNNFMEGDMIAYKYAGEANKDNMIWGIYHEDNNKNSYIYTLDTRDPNVRKPRYYFIPLSGNGTIMGSYGTVEQTYKQNQRLSEEDILETYIIS